MKRNKLAGAVFAIIIVLAAFASCDNKFVISILPERNHPASAKAPPAAQPEAPPETQTGAYTIVIDMFGNVPGDTVTASPDRGAEGDIATLAYTVANTAHYNLLDLGGVTTAIASVNGAGSGTRTYAINAADASNGVITITAVFEHEHTDMVIDPIVFSDTGHINKTYGDPAFTNAVVPGHLGSGAITYRSSDTTVAIVGGTGRVIILKAGSAVIIAEKAADTVYAHAQTNYTLTVAPKPVTITGLSASNKVYDGTTAATVTGTAVIVGLVGYDEVTASAGAAAFEDKTVGTGKTVAFSGWSLAGADAGNYTLSAQPASVTADITAKPVTIGLSAANKLYDGTTTATITGTAVIVGKIAGDDVSVVTGTAEFASATLGYDKTVIFSGWSLAGADAGNYILSAQPSVTADIVSKVFLDQMVLIPAGTFIMGSPESEPNRSSDEIQHPVTLTNSFYMCRFQVSRSQYLTVMGPTEDRTTDTYGRGVDFPIYYVNLYDAIVFCNRLSMMDGLDPVYSINGRTNPSEWGAIPTSSNATWNAAIMDKSKNGYRLPTEAEWEYVCRGDYPNKATETNTMPFGIWDGTKMLGSMANFNGTRPYDLARSGEYIDAGGTSLGKTTSVERYAANNYGLVGMHGNVWEWCWDRYGSYSGAQTDPDGAATGTNRVLRGGYWGSNGQQLRSAYRNSNSPGSRNYAFGFRVVRSN